MADCQNLNNQSITEVHSLMYYQLPVYINMYHPMYFKVIGFRNSKKSQNFWDLTVGTCNNVTLYMHPRQDPYSY